MYSGIKNASIPNSVYRSVDCICNVSLQIVQVFFFTTQAYSLWNQCHRY